MTDLDIGCYDLRTKDLRDRFAAFGRLPVNIDQLSVLELARRVCITTYGDHFIGDKAWLTMVSGIDRYADSLKEWAKGFLAAFAKTKQGKSKRNLIESYTPVWGDVAALDGLQMAVLGKCAVPLKARAEQFGMNRDPYRKARNYTAGAILLQAHQFEIELAWSVEYHRKQGA